MFLLLRAVKRTIAQLPWSGAELTAKRFLCSDAEVDASPEHTVEQTGMARPSAGGCGASSSSQLCPVAQTGPEPSSREGKRSATPL